MKNLCVTKTMKLLAIAVISMAVSTGFGADEEMAPADAKPAMETAAPADQKADDSMAAKPADNGKKMNKKASNKNKKGQKKSAKKRKACASSGSAPAAMAN